MIVTESEAREKWCPKAGSDDSMCIGARCMWWRPVADGLVVRVAAKSGETELVLQQYASAVGLIIIGPPPKVGYCGAAGRPEMLL